MDQLLAFLCAHQRCSEAVLLGHSTGCQDIVTYLASRTAKHRATVKAAILQVRQSSRTVSRQATATRHVNQVAGSGQVPYECRASVGNRLIR